jgi:hypothetical protein
VSFSLQVNVYRLVSSNTIEERILIRAQQKHAVQNTVYAGGFKMQAQEKDKDTVDINELFSKDELKAMLEGEPGVASASVSGASPSPAPADSKRPTPSPLPRISPSPSPVTPAAPGGLKHRLQEEGKEESNRPVKKQKAEAE